MEKNASSENIITTRKESVSNRESKLDADSELPEPAAFAALSDQEMRHLRPILSQMHHLQTNPQEMQKQGLAKKQNKEIFKNRLPQTQLSQTLNLDCGQTMDTDK